MNQTSPQGGMIGYLIGFLVLAVVVTLRMRNMNRERPLKIEALWIVPGIYALIAGFLYWRFPPQGMVIVWCLAGAAVGALLGWQRGRMMRIVVDPETHEIKQKGSLAAMFFLLGLIAVRYIARIEGAAWHIDVMAITDVLIAVALGLLSAQRVEMYLRAKRLLDEARGK
jgi:membrane protein CcdC involved in cytochrome C biogenesis